MLASRTPVVLTKSYGNCVAVSDSTYLFACFFLTQLSNLYHDLKLALTAISSFDISLVRLSDPLLHLLLCEPQLLHVVPRVNRENSDKVDI